MDTTAKTSGTAEDERSIRDLVAQSERLQNDAAALPRLHTDEAVIVNIAGRRLFGRRAFAEAMGAAVASPLGDVRTRLEVVDIRFAADDVALVSCVKRVHDGRSGAEEVDALPSSGALTYVLTRDDDSWRIALAQTTPVRHAGGDS
ncbi:SgcJ/EcaC family oxidoreductase [Streptomonospora litoralis]|uniref:DUF4440 domain-containing protein n=1 Tax=Streptomonospora litoralis TaxID=2498135 RepID=A0A4P6Q6C2_9ACTN|nr:SgcJ/EcaC family oxidoreductase [Streptomonospora litoralis]QBI56265.1 hypothetical protein EKD16_22560 [Streptomonospora litoralis]